MTNPFAGFVRTYRNDPVGFVKNCWTVTPDKWQANVLRDIASKVRQISVRSGHGVGKSAVAAWASIWFLLTRYPVRVVVTAATSGQLFDALYNEIGAWIGRLPESLRDLFEIKADSIVLKADPKNVFLTARTSRPDQPEALAGIHSEHVLIVVDEASGVPDVTFQAGSGSMSAESATTLLLGNPVRGSGFFYDTHTRMSPYWSTYHVSCLDSPRVSAEYIEQQATLWGRESNVFKVRVLGEFPDADDDTVIPLGLVLGAVDRDVSPLPMAPVVWGLDPARMGSSASALVKRRVNVVFEFPKTWRGLDTMQLVGVIRHEYENTPYELRPAEVLVDAIGIGAGVVDRLGEAGLPITGVNVSELPALLNTQYLNLRTELWFAVRDWLEKRDCVLPKHPDLIAQLPIPKIKFRSDGRLVVESKADLKSRGVPSPDVADALALTFAGWAGTALYGSARGHAKAPLRRDLGLA